MIRSGWLNGIGKKISSAAGCRLSSRSANGFRSICWPTSRHIQRHQRRFGQLSIGLDALLNEQNYRLASWRVASEEINYRRFFDINELAAIRTEETSVFRESHQLIFRLLKDGVATGLRIDHVDGLYDPEHYLIQLQHWAARELAARLRKVNRPSLFVVVEKILGKGEQLPIPGRSRGPPAMIF